MLLHDTQKKFGVVSIFLHWVTAVSVLALLVTGLFIVYVNWAASGLAPGDHHTVRFDPVFTGEAADTLRHLRVDALYLHILIGMCSIPFIVWRVYHRIRSGHPEEPRQGRVLSWLTSVNWPILLIMIVVMYVSGPFLPLLHGMSINAFDMTLFPAVFPMGVKQLDDFHAAFMLPIHVWIAIGMFVLVVLHIGGAIKHWLIDRDGVLERMLRPGELKERNLPGSSGPAQSTIEPKS